VLKLNPNYENIIENFGNVLTAKRINFIKQKIKAILRFVKIKI